MKEKASWRERLRSLFFCLSLVSLLWVIYILWSSWPQLEHSLSIMSVPWALVALLGFNIGGYLIFESFYSLFSWRHPNTCKRAELAHLFFSSQLMKHMPGRIWGIAYQVLSVPSIKASEWLGLNLTYMAMAGFFATLTACTILLLQVNELAAIIIATLGVGLYFYPWSLSSFSGLMPLIKKASFKNLENITKPVFCYLEINQKTKVRISSFFISSWLIYYLSWGFFGLSWPSTSLQDGIVLCALYTLAWFVGYISIVTPSGLGVRELVFVYLAANFPADVIAGMLVFGRFSLLIADITLGLIFMKFTYSPTKKTS